MAVTAKVYGRAQAGLANKEVDWDTDTIKCLLTTSTYTPDQDVHDFKDDITNEVANGNGYTTGGVTLASKTATYQAASNRLELDAADASWTGSGAGFTCRYAVVYVDTGVAATSRVLCYIDFGADQTVSAGSTFTIVWDSTGIVTLTAA